MTTHSRERREAVAKAITDARLRIAGNDTRNMALVLADAAIQTLLPETIAFATALDRYGLAYVRVAGLNECSDIDHVMAATENLKRRGRELFALVFGADDAQAGDQEGAEHDD